MNLHWIDWAIVAGLFVILNLSGYLGRKYIKGVTDFLVAGRSVGRYLGLGSDSMQAFGAITMLAYWQMNYKAGFAGQWWYLLYPIAGITVTLTGWGVFRLRQTRAMTLGQLVEMRYNRRTRIFFGILVYFAGVLNMGIFPAVGAGFFVYYCGLPSVLFVVGLEIPTILPIMLLLVGSATAICLWGGQVTLVVTDFVQSVFINVMLIGIMVVLYRTFTWDQFAQAFQSAPNGEALLNPFHAEQPSEFNKWFFFVFVFYWMFYGIISWAPNSMLISSSRDAHEAKMMRTMLHVRNLAMMGLGLLVLPLAAFVLMHHPDFAAQASQVNQVIEGIADEQVKSQVLTPAALVHILPVGMLGAFAGAVLFFIITSHDTYLLSWGSILIQDVIVPLRGKPLTPKQHLFWIRASVLVVAVFIILFSLLFHQVDNIFMFMAISASLYTASAGAVLLGALYWRRATTTAACVTMAVGAVLSILGFVCRSIYPDFLDGQTIAFWVALVCIGLYVIVSYLGKDPNFDLEALLHRKNRDHPQPSGRRRRAWRFGSEVPKSDRVLIPAIYATIALFLIFFVGTWVYNLLHDVPASSWLRFWHGYLYVMFTLGSVFLVWITAGGFRDLFRLFRSLTTQVIDEHDDGRVEDSQPAS